MQSLLSRQFRWITQVGPTGRIGFLSLSLRRRLGSGETRIPVRNIDYPLILRTESSDASVFVQIFVDEEYASLAELENVGLVIDCGANVGYSSAYFLSRFPNCHVVAIEPDKSNFDVLNRNLGPYGDRTTRVLAAVWPYETSLTMDPSPYRDGRQWARQVRACRPGEEGDIKGVSIAKVLSESGFDRISLLKVDIEGAEAIVFREQTEWLNEVDAMAIELHDDTQFGPASEIFFRAIKGQGFSVTTCGELVICTRTSSKAS